MSQKRAKISKTVDTLACRRNVAKSHNGAHRAIWALRHIAIGTFGLFLASNYFFCGGGHVHLNKFKIYLINKMRYLTVRQAPPSVVLGLND